jgi:hypothetical protein
MLQKKRSYALIPCVEWRKTDAWDGEIVFQLTTVSLFIIIIE